MNIIKLDAVKKNYNAHSTAIAKREPHEKEISHNKKGYCFYPMVK